MQICIIEHPRVVSETHFNDIANTPLWSCLLSGYAATALSSAGFDVTCLDAPAEGMDFDQAGKCVADLAPALLAINTVYIWEHTGRLFEFIADCKQANPAVHITVFGFFPSLAPHQLLENCAHVDSVCVGECEHTLRELAEAIQKNQNWQKTPGLAFTRKRRTVFSAVRAPASELDHFIFPRRPTDNPIQDHSTAAILGSRGCYNHCTFCPIPAFYNRGALWRGRSPENIVSEVTQLVETGYRRFYFVDPNFIGPGRSGRLRILELMNRLAPLNIRFGMETRPNDLDEELMAAMTRAGLDSLLLGIENASPGVLGTLSKHGSVNDSQRAIALCRDAGIEPEVGFIMHTPDTCLDDLADNLAFLENNRLLDRIDRTANLLCHQQIVFRGTRGFENYAQQGRLIGTDPTGFEARIAWRDDRARWVADVMVPVCLDVLRQMGDPDSALYWKAASTNNRAHVGVNDRLVAVFRYTVQTAKREKQLLDVQTAISGSCDKVFHFI